MPKTTNEKEEAKKVNVSKEKNKKVNKKSIASTVKKEDKKKILKTNDIKNKKAKRKTNKKDKIEEHIKENSIIEKIKSFLSKIVAMQEEQELEEDEENKKETDKINTKSKIKSKKSHMLEYYDLPYRYNETTVKILAQTPKKLFVYWDISDADRQKYQKTFGENFFEETYPVLLVHNIEKKYTFEVAINDFANSWYLDINDPKTKYIIELGRKFKNKPEIINIAKTEETKDIVLQNDYLPISISNTLEVPNDHILFEEIQTKVLYKNAKNHEESFVDISKEEFIKKSQKTYNIYELYKEIYKNEINEEDSFELLNPSSISSSLFK